MKIDLTQENPTIDAADLARVFDVEPGQVIALMRDGAITSLYETGIEDDAGSHRLTFWYGDFKVRFTCDSDGTVVRTTRIKAPRTA